MDAIGLGRIPGTPRLKTGVSIQEYDLSAPFNGAGTLRVVDIKRGSTYSFPDSDYDCFVFIAAGGRYLDIKSAGKSLRHYGAKHYGQVPGQGLTITNPRDKSQFSHWSRPASSVARVIVMQNCLDTTAQPVKPRLWSLTDLPFEERQQGIRLKSPYAHTHLPPRAGCEWVVANGIVRRHRHLKSTAVWLVLSGFGMVGIDVEGKKHTLEVLAGMYGHFPAGMWHGFCGRNLRFISTQIPDIGNHDYEFTEEDYLYSLS